MTRKIKYLLMCLLAAVSVPGWAVQDSLRFSLLTCEPGPEIYALFGHTALRCQRPALGTDVVFNYGMFNFRTPHFVLRFVKGETDYQLGVMPYPYFESEYALRGSSVYEQELNLTAPEKRRLLELLEDNYRTENRSIAIITFMTTVRPGPATRWNGQWKDRWSIPIRCPASRFGASFMSLRRTLRGGSWALTCVSVPRPTAK